MQDASFPTSQVREGPTYRRLSKREVDAIVVGLVAGRSRRSIAAELGRDEATVRRAAARPGIRKRVRRSQENRRAYEKRQAAAAVEAPKSRDEAAEDATARRSFGGADGRLLGVFTVGGADEGYAGPMSDRRRAELLDEHERAREARAALLREGWLVCDQTGAVYVRGRLPNPPHPPIDRDAERRELLQMVDAGWTPLPQFAALVEREVTRLREVEARLQELLDDLSPADREALTPADLHRIRQTL